MRIQLSDHFTYSKLIRFVIPSITMMVFTSVYSVVDGLFISNFVGKTLFAAINFIFPVLIIFGSVGFMIGAGGTAIVGKTLGEGDKELANQYFSMMIYALIGIGVAFGIIGFAVLRPICVLLGAEKKMIENCVMYGRILLLALPAFMLQNAFQSFFITAEKPKLGLAMSVISGVCNMILDAVLIVGCSMGLYGAGLATALSQTIGAAAALIYFARENDSLLQLTGKTGFYGMVLLKSCTNGSSEMVNVLAGSVVTMLYNYQLMRYMGENGIAAYGVIMYVGFIFAAIQYGYAMGSAPIVSFHFGAENTLELKNVFKKSLILVGAAGMAMALLSRMCAKPLSSVFVSYDEDLYRLTIHAFQIYSLSFLFNGISSFGSMFFTALNDGAVSAAISFLRTFLFEIGCVLILPYLMGMNGIWYAIIVAEFGAFAVTIVFLILKKKKYEY